MYPMDGENVMNILTVPELLHTSLSDKHPTLLPGQLHKLQVLSKPVQIIPHLKNYSTFVGFGIWLFYLQQNVIKLQ
jgi:hypothetical protein